MIKTKKNGLLKVAGLMLAIMMLATCVISGTLAKYTSKGTKSISAQIAKWDIQVGGAPITAALPLSDFTILDQDATTATGYEEKHVEEGKIAPGTWGYASVKVENKSEVDAKIIATFEKDSSGSNLPKGMKIAILDAVPSAPTAITEDVLEKSVTLDRTDTTSTDIVIAFLWDYDNSGAGTYDEEDTNKGIAAKTSADLTLGTLTVVAEQVD